MCLLFETIKVHNRQLYNLELHNHRVENSRRKLFPSSHSIALQDYLELPSHLDHTLHKCRVMYGETIHKIEFIPYVPKQVRNLKIVFDDTIQYPLKYFDRACFDNLLSKVSTDDILIVRRGQITDVSYANIIFFDGKKWSTPSHPLFQGIKRQILLEKGFIVEEEISPNDLHRFKYATLINAMLDIGDVPFIPIENILSP